jgi:hypothetical protein
MGFGFLVVNPGRSHLILVDDSMFGKNDLTELPDVQFSNDKMCDYQHEIWLSAIART